MKKTFLCKVLHIIVAFAFLMILVSPVTVQAQDLGMNYAANLGLSNGNGQTPQQMAITIVRWLMTFLGIVATVMILYGGFVWMTAGGNEDKVGTAKKIIGAGVVGLIIVIAGFAIVTWVIGTSQSLVSNGTI